ncbi:MAG: hypothetical protein AAF196_00200 [Planctomycetota bacterium]
MEERHHPVPLYIILGMALAVFGLAFLFEWMDRSPIIGLIAIVGTAVTVCVVLIAMARSHPSDNSRLSRLYRWLCTDRGPYRYPKSDGSEEKPIDPFGGA